MDSLPTVAASSVSPVGLGISSGVSAAPETNALLYLQTDSSNAINESNTSNNKLEQGIETCVTGDDSYEDDNTRASAKALSVGTPQRHNFGGPTDEDWVSVSLEAGKTYSFTTSSLDYAADSVLELYDPDGILLLANDDVNGGLGSEIIYAPSSASIYYLRVRHWNSNAGGCGTSYSLDTSSIDTMPPDLTWISPVSNEQVFTTDHGNVSLEVNVTDNQGIARVLFDRWDAANSRFITLSVDIGSPYLAAVNVVDLNMAWNQIDATAIDVAGNVTSKFIWIYRSAPLPIGTTPAPITIVPPIITTVPPIITTVPPIVTTRPSIVTTTPPPVPTTITPTPSARRVYLPMLGR